MYRNKAAIPQTAPLQTKPRSAAHGVHSLQTGLEHSVSNTSITANLASLGSMNCSSTLHQAPQFQQLKPPLTLIFMRRLGIQWAMSSVDRAGAGAHKARGHERDQAVHWLMTASMDLVRPNVRANRTAEAGTVSPD